MTKTNEYYTVEVNNHIKIMTQDFKSAHETMVFQRILGNDPILKKNNKVIKGDEK